MQEVSVKQVADAGPEVQLLDVRESGEFAEAHVDGAIWIPMGQLPSRLDELDRTRPVHVICRSGNRSGRMTELLGSQGFDAANVVGGMIAWVDSGRSVRSG